ncbi:hypothetical protein SBOR_7985 [Sclerotinia borealis F-4128]|uniref:Uncharacterized protein n=1 Tax=Sclerotinia borealis (strain F-4128) TaxID=1432307 RepID=W9C790_SCLBF|nr:hypothetical protein SBOR_7985 [Sclerotinia borealis F-4128]
MAKLGRQKQALMMEHSEPTTLLGGISYFETRSDVVIQGLEACLAVVEILPPVVFVAFGWNTTLTRQQAQGKLCLIFMHFSSVSKPNVLRN